MFSIGGRYFVGEPITYTYIEDRIFETSRNVSIKLHHRIGRYVKLQLHFAAKWIMISEVTFDSGRQWLLLAVCHTLFHFCFPHLLLILLSCNYQIGYSVSSLRICTLKVTKIHVLFSFFYDPCICASGIRFIFTLSFTYLYCLILSFNNKTNPFRILFFIIRSYGVRGGVVVKALRYKPAGVIGIFQWHNPSGRNMALGSTHPLTEMSTRCISWG